MKNKFILILLITHSFSLFAFTNECAKELKTNCPKADNDVAKVRCLTKLKVKPAENCQKALASALAAAGNCTSNIVEFCPEAKDFNAVDNSQCLLKNRIKISPRCFEEVNSQVENLKDKQKESESEFVTACKEDILAACQKLEPKSYKCFREAAKANKLKSKKCRAYMKNFSHTWQNKMEQM